jgi:hypothetical protein
MVTRRSSQGVANGENQRVSVEEAIKVWTLDGAYASFEENTKGSITPGKLADFVVLEKDPRQVPPLAIKDIPLQAVYLGGKQVLPATAKDAFIVPVPPIDYGDGDEEGNDNPSRLP